MEETLKKTEEIFRLYLENNTHDGVGIFDEDRTIEYANLRLHKIFGVEAGEMIGKPFTDFSWMKIPHSCWRIDSKEE